MNNKTVKCFLAANSCEGFYSEFESCCIPDGKWRAYIIKGGPGTGKSSFMKRFAERAVQKGHKAVICPCSSDPNSLDAVILPQKKLVLLDGTAPHTVEPKFPGVCEKILNFGEFWNTDHFCGREHEIIESTLKNKALHACAARYIQSAGQLLLDNRKTALACTDREKTEKTAKRLCKKLIPEKNSELGGCEYSGFLSGITPMGVVSFPETVLSEAEETVIISDPYGGASGIITDEVRSYALKNGYEIISLKNPFFPSLLYDHIIIPELSLAFATENRFMSINDTSRRIHATRFSEKNNLYLNRNKLKMNRKTAEMLLNFAANMLAQAKAEHDRLESYYISAMDFEALDRYCDCFIKEVL